MGFRGSPVVTEPSRAVFLSHASQDAEAAARICSALRSAGIEVWFDRSDLRGGDAWDRQIRERIHDCRLFIAVISANTEARSEGYFRREWKFAVDRTHDMSERVAFIVPVVIDGTADARADVPEAFRSVQWTQLPGGETPPDFVARIKGLTTRESASKAVQESVGLTAAAAPPLPVVKPQQMKGAWPVIVAVLLAAALAYIITDKLWISRHAPTSQSGMSPAAVTATTAGVAEKSIAVLPFVNMSPDKDQEYFADGLAEELLDLLAKTPGLHVIARTSSFSFKGKSEDIPTIAAKLKVANILEGSVRKSGNRLRVTTQLVRAADGEHLWSETYDRELKDIFKVQDEIAGAVVKALKVSLLEGETPRATPTSSTEAYTLYLQALAIAANASQQTDVSRAIDRFEQALKLDPNFARAWAALAGWRVTDFELYTSGVYEQVIPAARYAAEQALKLDPKLSDAHFAMSAVLTAEWNWKAAEAEINRGLALDPGNADAFAVATVVALTQGHFNEALQLAKRVVALDPLSALNYGTFAGLGGAYLASGRLAEAETAYRQSINLAPTMSQGHFLVGWALLARHEPAAALAEMEQETDDRYRDVGRALALDALGRKAEADRAVAVAKSKYAGVVEYPIAVFYANRNELDETFAWLDHAYKLHDGWVPWVPWDPLLKNVRADPRYKAFLRKINVPD